ncbi:armadillo repeat-containing protein 8 isoform X2 [Brevipalpus obovatus]|uniref:armadillo repeat-containing protein 8 isoform X2 n=1 Tax=Brevipalpus obovatus TaxID=246614 RepID=UPI003D9F773A
MDTLHHLEEWCFQSTPSVNLLESINSEDHDKCIKSIVYIKNNVIGSNKQKEHIIELGVVPCLLNLLQADNVNEQLKYEIVAIICSLAKGTAAHIKALIDAGVVTILIRAIINSESSHRLLEISLRALRSIFTSSLAPVDVIYETEAYDSPLITFLLNLASSSKSCYVQECIANLLASSCVTADHQIALCNYGAIRTIAGLMLSPAYKVKLPAMELLANICYQNKTVSKVAISTTLAGRSIPQILIDLMGQDQTPIMQLTAARCMTYLCRAEAIESDDNMIRYKTLPTLARMCKKDKDPQTRASAANALAYLTEVDTELQKIASILDHIIPTLADFFNCQPDQSINYSIRAFTPGDGPSLGESPVKNYKDRLPVAQEMREAAFKAFASLAANEEDIRKRIIDTKGLMDHIVKGLSDSNTRVQKAALRCLHSLSRSVQQLRTTFQDHAVWIPLKNLLNNASDDVMIVVSSTLCNLLLEFSPSKEHFLDRAAVETLCSFTQRDEPALRLNGVWALMNMAFQAEQGIKLQILSYLGTTQIFRLLSDPDTNIVLKTLGLIRNLLSTKLHIDHIMVSYGKQLMSAVSMVLDEDHEIGIKEQALCILANIASGTSAKELIMKDEQILKKLIHYMMHENVKLQIAAVFCISNLVWADEEDAAKRQEKLIELGVKRNLEELLHSDDMTLFDKVKTALDQFSHK